MSLGSASVDLDGIMSYVAVFHNTESCASDPWYYMGVWSETVPWGTPCTYTNKCHIWRVSSDVTDSLGDPVRENVTDD